MKRTVLTVLVLFCLATVTAEAQRPSPDNIQTGNGTITVQPIQHGTLVLSWNGTTVYADPTGGAGTYEEIDAPDLILITDIHGDHLNLETLNALDTERSQLVVPQAVADRLPATYDDRTTVIGNGESTEQMGISIRAIPMYNLPETGDSRHPKGRGNGYVLTMGGKNIYLSGDTEGIPEMRSLENIDVAFVCMNLPYTMDVEQAVDSVMDFKPAIVYPYHYRGQDTERFKELVHAGDEGIEVRLRDWYPGD